MKKSIVIEGTDVRLVGNGTESDGNDNVGN